MGRSLTFLLLLLVTVQTSQATGLTDNWEAAIRTNEPNELWRMANQSDAASRVTKEGKTLLMAASSLGDSRLTRHLIKRGADVNATNERGGTALMYAASQGHLEIVEQLIGAGARVNHRAENGWSALLLAASKGFELVIQRLLDFSADPNNVDMFGFSPLMRAIANGKQDAARTLLSVDRVKLDIRNTRNQNALELSIASGQCGLTRSVMAAFKRRDLSVPESTSTAYRDMNCPS